MLFLRVLLVWLFITTTGPKYSAKMNYYCCLSQTVTILFFLVLSLCSAPVRLPLQPAKSAFCPLPSVTGESELTAARSFRLIRSYLTYNPRFKQYFSLIPNQSAVLSAMAYKPNQPKRTGYELHITCLTCLR